MSDYRRVRIEGGTYFYTVTLANRKSRLLMEENKLLLASIRKVQKKRPFAMRGWVVLPDHLHCIWTLPKGDHDYSGRWRAIKTLFSKNCKKNSRTQIKSVWQPRFWEHTIHSAEDFKRHLDYIHINPVKHNYVKQVKDWPLSSFHTYVNNGVYTLDWGGVPID